MTPYLAFARLAISMDYQMNFCGTRAPEERYRMVSVANADDYEIIWPAARPGFCHHPNHDFRYSLFRIADGSDVDAKKVFGVPGASFEFIMPQGALLKY